MNRKRYLTILTIVTIICIIIGILTQVGKFVGRRIFIDPGIDAIWESEVTSDTDVTKITASHDVGDLSEIKIDLDACEVILQQGEGKEATILYEGDTALEPVFSEENGVWSIRQKKSFHVSVGSVEGVLTITLPAELEPVALEADIDAGTLEMKGCRIGKTEIDVDAGSVVLDSVSMTRGQIDVDAGEVTLTDCTFETLSIDVAAGDVEIIGGSDLSRYALDLKVDLGELNINGKEVSKAYVQQGTEGTLEAEVDLGNLTIS